MTLKPGSSWKNGKDDAGVVRRHCKFQGAAHNALISSCLDFGEQIRQGFCSLCLAYPHSVLPPGSGVFGAPSGENRVAQLSAVRSRPVTLSRPPSSRKTFRPTSPQAQRRRPAPVSIAKATQRPVELLDPLNGWSGWKVRFPAIRSARSRWMARRRLLANAPRDRLA